MLKQDREGEFLGYKNGREWWQETHSVKILATFETIKTWPVFGVNRTSAILIQSYGVLFCVCIRMWDQKWGIDRNYNQIQDRHLVPNSIVCFERVERTLFSNFEICEVVYKFKRGSSFFQTFCGVDLYKFLMYSLKINWPFPKNVPVFLFSFCKNKISNYY